MRGDVETRGTVSDEGTARLEGKASKGGCTRGDDRRIVSLRLYVSNGSSSDDWLETSRVALESEKDCFGRSSGWLVTRTGFGRSLEEEEKIGNRVDPMTGSRVQ